MIYNHVKRYLKEKLSKPNIQQSWGTLDNVQFFNYLYQRYSDKDIEKEISEVKEAFRDFFEPVGTIVFRYSIEDGIRFKIFPYQVDPKNSKHLNTIVSIINKNKKAIIYPYQGKTDQIAITGTIRRKVNLEINSVKESVNKKELIKYAIRKALDLGDRDVIVQLKRKYLVKIFSSNKIIKHLDEDMQKQKGIANRFNGYSEEEMEENYDSIFNTMDEDEFFKPIMKYIFKNQLDFSQISNAYYEENALRILQKSIAEELINYLSFEEDFIFGLAGYILRKHFYKIHEYIAIELLEQVYKKNQNAKKFLLYYSGKSIVKNNKRYQIPSLETKDGKQWSNSAVLGLSALWISTRIKIKNHQKKLIELEEKITLAKENYNSVILQIEKLTNDMQAKNDIINQLKQDMKDKDRQLLSLAEQGKRYNDEEWQLKVKKVDDEKQIKILQNEIRDIRDELQLHKKSIVGLEQFKKHYKKIQHDIDAVYANMELNIGKVNLILESLTCALMSRSKLIE